MILPISSREPAIYEKRHISPKENERQNGLETVLYACFKISATSCRWEDLVPSCWEKHLWIITVKQVASFYQTCEYRAKFG